MNGMGTASKRFCGVTGAVRMRDVTGAVKIHE